MSNRISLRVLPRHRRYQLPQALLRLPFKLKLLDIGWLIIVPTCGPVHFDQVAFGVGEIDGEREAMIPGVEYLQTARFCLTIEFKEFPGRFDAQADMRGARIIFKNSQVMILFMRVTGDKSV